MLSGGHQVADIAVLYPIESIWTRFRPARAMASDSPAAGQVESAYHAAADGLYGSGRDFTFVDSRALVEAKAAGGVLAHGKLRWRVIVLPGADTLPLRAWENLAEFVRTGGVVVALGALPANSEAEFPSPRVQAISRRLFGLPAGPSVRANAAGGAGIYLPLGAEALLPDVIQSVLDPDVRLPARGAPIKSTHRRIDGHDVYLLINDSAEEWRGLVAVAATGAGEVWDPGTGRASPVARPSAIPLRLGPYDARLLRFASAVPPKRLHLVSGAIPGLTLRDLAPVQPVVGKGEFVQGGLVAGAMSLPAGRPSWLTRGTLTKGQVDTHLMVSFRYPNRAGLEGADSVVLDTWAPDGQQTPTQLLVMLHEEGGGIYVAELSRSLGAPGLAQSFVPISRFRPAGWTNDANGRLDLDRVTAISVGWGGYFGALGETVSFGVAAPRVGLRKAAR
jgi:hypothetical protein